MAIPRPALLAIAGAVLSMLSFSAMRTMNAQSGADSATSAPVAQSAAAGGQAKPGAKRVAKLTPAARPAPRLADVPRAVSSALADGRVVVLLFTERRAADDAATGRHFALLSRLRKVRTFRAGIADLGRYAGIVSRLGITQAPAIVIVRPDLRVLPPIEGYVESRYLLQRVKDQLR